MLSEVRIEQLGITVDIYQKAVNVWVASGVYQGHHIVVEQMTQGTAVNAWHHAAISINDEQSH